MIKRAFQDVSDWLRLKKSYRAVYDMPAGKVVFRDLAKVCFAAQSTFDVNSHEAARREGMRQVWLSIQAQLNMTDAELFELAKGE